MRPALSEPAVKQLYDRDFLEWTRSNAALLRAGCFGQADMEHIAEEIEDMGKSQQRALENRLSVLLAHLLKWKYQPQRRGRSWEATMELQRLKVAKLLRKMPSLRHYLAEAVTDAYPEARVMAARETRLEKGGFPESCPFTLDQILDPGFLPAPGADPAADQLPDR